MNYIKVTIKDKQTLMLESDAKKGDLINLSDLMHIDVSIIEQSIIDGSNKVYLKHLEALKEQLKMENQNNLNNSLKEYELRNNELSEQLKFIKDITTKELELKFKDELYSYNIKINELNNTNNSLKEEFKSKEALLKASNEALVLKEQQLQVNNINALKVELNALKQELKSINEKNTLENSNQLLTVEQKYKDEAQLLINKQNEIKEELDNLKRDKSIVNVKRIGENLESWCDNEFNSNNLIMPKNIVWQKDNDIVKGHKADFIYKVYATDERLDEHLLTSAILEMKSEDPLAASKQNLNTILKKLDTDRTNKNIEYAILVSELEYDNSNDIPVRRVLEYDKMFIVRPQYFMTLLNIITSFGLKYQDILLAKEEERIKFKDLEEILLEFETMKNEILDNSIRHIETQLDEVLKQTVIISKANEKIIDATKLIIDRHLKTVVNKINEFKINRITNNIDNL